MMDEELGSVEMKVAHIFGAFVAGAVAGGALLFTAGLGLLAATWGYNWFIVFVLLAGFFVFGGAVAAAISIIRRP